MIFAKLQVRKNSNSSGIRKNRKDKGVIGLLKNHGTPKNLFGPLKMHWTPKTSWDP